MKKNKAFTLIEILLVVVIFGIILALAVPNFSQSYSRFQLNKTADDLLGVSRWAQAMAIGQESTYALAFSDDYRSYNLVRATVNDQTGNVDDFKPVPGSLGRMHAVPDDLQLTLTVVSESQATGDMDRIEFHPDGTIDQALIQLESPKGNITLSSKEIRGMMIKVNND